MLTELRVLTITCDSCGKIAPCCQEYLTDHKHQLLMNTRVTDADIDDVRRSLAAEDNWTENGEGKTHCPACDPLTLTDDAKAERARERERSGLTLFELEGTPS